MRVHLRVGVFALLLLSSPAVAETVAGQASVIDGDTLEIHGQRIRLHGIDAPESRQICQDAVGADFRCGQRAALALDEMIDGRPVTCEGREHDRYRRLIAVCSAGGADLNRRMVAAGLAMAYRKYSLDYTADEDAAKAGRTGLWAGSWRAPWEWRAARR